MSAVADPDRWEQCDLCHRPVHPSSLLGVNTDLGAWHPGCELPPGRCPCTTPWDEPKPQLEIDIRGRISTSEVHPIPDANLHVTVRADRVLDGLGMAVVGRWTPHLRQAAAQSWTAEVDGGGVVIRRMGPRSTGGYHCVMCHRDFANQSVAAVHQRSMMSRCLDPTSIVDAWSGRLLLEQTRVGGMPVWGWSRPPVSYETALRLLRGGS